MTAQPLKLGMTKEEFTAYVGSIHPKIFFDPPTNQHTPIFGCVLHNTFMPDLAMVQLLSTREVSCFKRLTFQPHTDERACASRLFLVLNFDLTSASGL